MSTDNVTKFIEWLDKAKEFAPIRIFGSIGWIVAGLLIGYFSWESLNTLKNTFYMSSFISLILGIYSFTLPNTPPTIEKNKSKAFVFNNAANIVPKITPIITNVA